MEAVIHLTPFESTLIVGGKTAAERGPVRWVEGFVNLPCETLPPRQRVSIADFERDMVAAGVRKPPV